MLKIIDLLVELVIPSKPKWHEVSQELPGCARNNENLITTLLLVMIHKIIVYYQKHGIQMFKYRVCWTQTKLYAGNANFLALNAFNFKIKG